MTNKIMDLCDYFATERVTERIQEGMQIILGINPGPFDFKPDTLWETIGGIDGDRLYNGRELNSGEKYQRLVESRDSLASEFRSSGSTLWRAGRMANEMMDDIIGHRVFTSHYVIDPELVCQQNEPKGDLGLDRYEAYFGLGEIKRYDLND